METILMEQCSSWETNNCCANEGITHLLWNQKVHHCVHKSPPMAPTLSQMTPVHNFSSLFSKIHSSITLPSMPKSSKWSLPFTFSDQNFVCTSHLCSEWSMHCPYHSLWFDHPNNIWRSTQVMELFIMQFYPSPTSSFLRPKYSPQHPVLRHPQSVFHDYYIILLSWNEIGEIILKHGINLYLKRQL